MSQPPQYQTSIFDSSYFNATNGALTITTADKRYVMIGSNAFLNSLTATTLTGTLQTGAQGNITSLGILSNLTLSTGGTGLQIPNLKFYNSTTVSYDNFNHSYYLSVVEGGCVASKALVVDSNKDIGSIRNLSCSGTFTASTSISTPSLTTDTITKAGTQTMSATTLNLNPTTLQIKGTTLSATATELNALSGLTASSTELNYNDITTLGTFQLSKVMTSDASGIGLMPLGTAATNCLRFFGGTAFKETMNIYRDSDSSGLTIASRTSGTSINKTYPLLKLVSTIDPSNLGTGSGVAAQNAVSCKSFGTISLLRASHHRLIDSALILELPDHTRAVSRILSRWLQVETLSRSTLLDRPRIQLAIVSTSYRIRSTNCYIIPIRRTLMLPMVQQISLSTIRHCISRALMI